MIETGPLYYSVTRHSSSNDPIGAVLWTAGPTWSGPSIGKVTFKRECRKISWLKFVRRATMNGEQGCQNVSLVSGMDAYNGRVLRAGTFSSLSYGLEVSGRSPLPVWPVGMLNKCSMFISLQCQFRKVNLLLLADVQLVWPSSHSRNTNVPDDTPLIPI